MINHIGKYAVRSLLGEGATSEVYLCHDTFNDRDVAVKAVFANRLKDADGVNLTRKLFITEASLAGKLQHPHIVQIFDAVVGEDLSYIVMEFVPGGTVEPGATPADEVVRELREEAKLEAIGPAVAIALLHDPQAFTWEIVHRLTVDARAMPEIGWEYDEFRMVAIDERSMAALTPLAPVALQMMPIARRVLGVDA